MSELYKPPLTLRRIEGQPPRPVSDELTEMAEVYADAFAGPPWNEYTKCPSDNAFYGRETEVGEPCPDDNVPLELAYPQEATEEYIINELDRRQASLFLLESDKEIAGFSWGFAYENPEQFATEKYRTPEMQEKITRLLGEQGIKGAFYYLSESAIRDNPKYRGRGISSQFHIARLEVAAEYELPAIQRTSSKGPMYRTSSKYMRQIMGPEMTVDTKARTFTSTGCIVNGVEDTEMEGRVLFKRP